VTLRCHGPYDSTAAAHPARQLDVAVFPSLCAESYGLVVEEALARGVPVVVSDRGALPERVRGGGIVVSVDAVEPLAQTLRELAADRGRLEELWRNAPRSFSTIRDAADRYRELYAEARG
jgi:glycosyltransferase involved in cell wall biosynthesis